MADWDVIAKQRLTEDWGTLRAAYLPLNQAMRRTVEFLEKESGTFSELLVVVRERFEGSLKNLSALADRRSPWVRLEAIRNLRVLATGLRGAANDDPLALLRYQFALCELLTNVWKDAPTEARVTHNLSLVKEPEFWFGCDCCAVGILRPAGPDDPPELLRGKDVRLVWEVDALYAWTLDEFEDYLASERYSLPTTPRIAAVEDLGLPVVDVPADQLRRGADLFGGQGGGLFGPLDLRYLDLS
ncbi:MAG: hypothetical protein HY076_07720 [Candidatus Eisenbacteria bacterium]|uniref:Uncharacterized protein n=1 Tax=Eiseniibacteriota bacterium TaxID=2212470 RepID=A0A9D6L7F5_UNCEI|nr:hypothetical protein [Candidatus Eisenbacteria bacterium]MBI3540146.1 hypothetical protein [Candidatus Eisenbacteria bacterium]